MTISDSTATTSFDPSYGTANQFGHTSELHIHASDKNGQTYLSDVHFTAPFKIMQPFKKRDGSLQVMLLQASAGIMDGDRQRFSFEIDPGAKLEFISQSYDKVHPMKEDFAERSIEVTCAHDSMFYFHPQPMIPFRNSRFINKMEIHLEDGTAAFSLCEIFTAGRLGYENERFAYDYYSNKVDIYRGSRHIYRDNTLFAPDQMDMEGMGMYEGCTHQANLFLTRLSADGFEDSIQEILDEDAKTEGAITRLIDEDYAVRILGHRAQDLEMITGKVLTAWGSSCCPQ
ncbi:MAG: urease accessory protein UreD [Lachnospiraceae bacterium]|nr:urease accessory protein UreD [Lachnospiraceae bacterium]